MANLKEVRTRISSVNSTRQITSAMKMVSAAKLRKAQGAILQLRPYSDKLYEILKNISKNIGLKDNPYAEERENIGRVLIVMITSNRGLCGAFNQNVIKKAKQLAHDDYSELHENGKLEYMCIGKKGQELMVAENYPVPAENNSLLDNVSFDNVERVAEKLMKKFLQKKYDKIEILYHRFKNAAVQDLVREQFLPIENTQSQEVYKSLVNNSKDIIFEPDMELILKRVIPRSLKIQLYRALLDSSASEHGARMTAMHQATDNATELIKDLKLEYNKARQAAITNEILEIVSGAEALKK